MVQVPQAEVALERHLVHLVNVALQPPAGTSCVGLVLCCVVCGGFSERQIIRERICGEKCRRFVHVPLVIDEQPVANL
jgi:hypothetical protein